MVKNKLIKTTIRFRTPAMMIIIGFILAIIGAFIIKGYNDIYGEGMILFGIVLIISTGLINWGEEDGKKN